MPVDDPRRGQRPRRLLFGWYLDGTDGGNGALVVLPRRFDDRLAPAGPDCTTPWPGEVDVLLPPGSAVVFTTDLWHAAKQPAAGAPRRYLMGAHVQARSDSTPHPEDHVHVGPEVDAAIAETPELGALLA